MKYKDWLDVWFANYIEPSSKTKTCERYSEIIEKHLKVKLGEYELEELSPIVIQKYITELMQSGNLTTGKGLAANSVNGIITVIQNSLKLAYTLGELKEYTTDKIRRPKTKEKEVSCFSLAEQKKIEQAALSNKKRKFIRIVICLYSGLRIGELLALTWADIDFTKGTLAVNKTCHDGRDEKRNLCRITDLPKTTSSKRMIPLPKKLLPVLKEYKRKSVSEYVVESEKGVPPTVRSYQRTFELLQKRLHINYQDLQGIGITGKLALPTLISLCSIALGRSTLANLVIIGDISISGTLIKADELANVLQVCLDSGAKKVLLPSTSFVDFSTVPADLMSAFQLIPYTSAEDAVYKALGVE